MKGKLFLFQSSILSVIFLAILVGNIFFWTNPILGVLLLIFYLFFYGQRIGSAVAPRETGPLQWWIGIWTLLSFVMIVGSAVYYAAPLKPEFAYTLLLLTVPVALWLQARFGNDAGFFRRVHDLFSEKEHRIPAVIYFQSATIAFFLFLIAKTLFDAQTLDAVRTPWVLVSSSLFVAMGFALLLILVQLYRGQERALSIALFSATLFLFLAVAAIVFPLGFGFDSFIHKATESHIALEGTITPKPFYYIGQYSLVLFLHFGFTLPISLVDTLLVPVLTALLLPMAWYSAGAHLLGKKRLAAGTLFGIFLIPLSSFIVTTPQGLANLWILLCVLAAVPYLLTLEKPRLFPLLIPAIATVLTHPIAGIPIIIFLALLGTDPQFANQKLKVTSRILFWTILLFGCILLPASFVTNAYLSGSTLGVDLSALHPSNLIAALHIDLFLENRYNPLFDFVYLYGFNAIAIALAASVAGWWTFKKQLAGSLRILWAMVVILLINFLLLSTAVDFSFLIDYERLNYANRLIPLMVFFLAPFFILALGGLIDRLKRTPVIVQILTLLLLTGAATSAFYFTYPRHDAYVIGHGFNVSQNDLSAVRLIEEMHVSDAPYAVLANQTVSAAAISEIGFAQYFGDLFFYPIPTGGELYEHFLNMNEAPTRGAAAEALSVLSEQCRPGSICPDQPVETIYFVVNDYWWEAARIVESAKASANQWVSVGGGAIHIFTYSFQED